MSHSEREDKITRSVTCHAHFNADSVFHVSLIPYSIRQRECSIHYTQSPRAQRHVSFRTTTPICLVLLDFPTSTLICDVLGCDLTDFYIDDHPSCRAASISCSSRSRVLFNFCVLFIFIFLFESAPTSSHIKAPLTADHTSSQLSRGCIQTPSPVCVCSWPSPSPLRFPFLLLVTEEPSPRALAWYQAFAVSDLSKRLDAPSRYSHLTQLDRNL